jgi:hypothetical protein
MPTEEETYRAGVQQKLEEILRQVRYTNGKVRKMIIARVLIGGILIGQAFTNMHDIISLLSNVF